MTNNLHSPLPDRAGHRASPAHLSLQGSGRDENQDARAVGDDVWLVADGMGGHSGGRTASRAAAVAADSSGGSNPLAPLIEIIETAHEAVLEAAHKCGMPDMGTTMVVASRNSEAGVLRVAWAGDSRAYQLTATGLRRLTDDHNFAEADRVARGLDYDDVWDHAGQHLLTSFLGGGKLEVPEIGVRVLAPRGRLLLCTDGLTSGLRDDEIEAFLRVGSPEDAAQLLVSGALDGGSTDDVTVIVVDLTSPPQHLDLKGTPMAFYQGSRLDPVTDAVHALGGVDIRPVSGGTHDYTLRGLSAIGYDIGGQILRTSIFLTEEEDIEELTNWVTVQARPRSGALTVVPNLDESVGRILLLVERLLPLGVEDAELIGREAVLYATAWAEGATLELADLPDPNHVIPSVDSEARTARGCCTGARPPSRQPRNCRLPPTMPRSEFTGRIGRFLSTFVLAISY